MDNRENPRYKATSPGVDDSTCEVTNCLTNSSKLPIPPPEIQRRQTLSEFTRLAVNSQPQSLFFNLPAEIKIQIYGELFGHRRVHIDYAFCQPSHWNPLKKRPNDEWQWWHEVCRDFDAFRDGKETCECPSAAYFWHRSSSYWEGLTAAGWEEDRKMPGGAWLRSCQLAYEEAIPILYGTNVFVMGDPMDTLFRMSRILPVGSLHLITALDISLSLHVGHDRVMKLDEEWKEIYLKFVGVLQDKFPAMKKLRAVIYLDGFCKGWSVPAQEGDQIMGPWEALAASREWKLLDLHFPWGRINSFEPRLKAQGMYPD